jgi:hypothetical protein
LKKYFYIFPKIYLDIRLLLYFEIPDKMAIETNKDTIDLIIQFLSIAGKEDKRRIFEHILRNNMITANDDTDVGVCKLCSKITICDSGNKEDGRCDKCGDFICIECNGLIFLPSGPGQIESTVDDDGTEMISFTPPNGEFVCPSCQN